MTDPEDSSSSDTQSILQDPLKGSRDLPPHSGDEREKSRVFDMAALSSVAAVWWGTSTFKNIYVKDYFHSLDQEATFSDALAVAWITFAFGTLFYLGVRQVDEPDRRAPLPSLATVAWRTRVPGVLHCVSSVATFSAMALSGITSTQMFKALEPMFVVLFLRILQPAKFKRDLAGWPLCFVFLIVAGVGMAGFSPQFTLSAFVVATISSVAGGAKTVIAKELPFQKVHVFGGCCLVSTVVLSWAVLLPSFRRAVANRNILFAAVCYATYNLFSFLVLGQVTSATHSLLKALKRVAIILGAALVNGEAVPPIVWGGIYVATIGSSLYKSARQLTSTQIVTRVLQVTVFVGVAASLVFSRRAGEEKT